MPAMQPWPKMPRQPAKKGWRFPSRSTCWCMRNWMIAWAVVSFLVFMALLDGNYWPRRKPNKISKPAAFGNKLQSFSFVGHEIGAAVASDDDGATRVAHAGRLVIVPAFH